MRIVGICCSLYAIITCVKAIKKLSWGGDYDIIEITISADGRSRQNKITLSLATTSDLNRNKIEVSRRILNKIVIVLVALLLSFYLSI